MGTLSETPAKGAEQRSNALTRLLKTLFVERRLPIRCYKLYYRLLSRMGLRFETIRRGNGLVIKGHTRSLWMFYETWSKKDYDIPGFTLTTNMTVVDVGANQGFFSLYATSKGATVYAFEPCRGNFEILKRNVAKNYMEERVKLFNAAVTGKNGEVSLFVGLNAAGDILSESVSTAMWNEGSQTRSVESRTLDSVFQDLHIARCDLLKMDCEGAEYEILQSMSQDCFRKIARIAMECHENSTGEAVGLLKKAGFQVTYEDWGMAGTDEGHEQPTYSKSNLTCNRRNSNLPRGHGHFGQFVWAKHKSRRELAS